MNNVQMRTEYARPAHFTHKTCKCRRIERTGQRDRQRKRKEGERDRESRIICMIIKQKKRLCNLDIYVKIHHRKRILSRDGLNKRREHISYLYKIILYIYIIDEVLSRERDYTREI